MDESHERRSASGHTPYVVGTIMFIRTCGYHNRTEYAFDSDWKEAIACRNELCSGGSLWLRDALRTMDEEGLLAPGGTRSFSCAGHEPLGESATRPCIFGWKLTIASVCA